ncbi:MAG: hypothetical protein EP318_14980 [Rhodobacteraceae bacterium]|nr:MAG: hypothetical protein EP318_14980 [Paracoccaceae bacterium]
MSRVTPELLDALPGLKALQEVSADTQEQASGVEIEPWRVERQAERFEIIKPALGTKPRSRARAEALAKIAAQTVIYGGRKQRLHVKTFREWLIAYDRDGLAGLLPKPNGEPGKRRVLVSRAWDQGIDLSAEAMSSVAGMLERYCLSLIAKSMSGRKVRVLAGKRLVELCEGAGSGLDRKQLEKLCKVTQKYTDRLADWKRVARHDQDNKAFFDRDLPRIARGKCDWPMEVVYGDVHPIDIYVRDHDAGGQLRLRLIAWMDDYSRHMWVTVAVLGKGQGIRQTDIADALYNLVCDPAAGVPRVIYLDNGGEYSALGAAMLEIPGAIDALSSAGGRVLAQPYNGPAKGGLEGAFGKLEQGYLRHIPGWIGGDRTNKKTHAVGKPVKGFEGPIEDLIQAVLDMVAVYNDTPQDGLLDGLSPRQAMQDAMDRGWQAVTLDEDAFDFAFSRRDARQITQGKFRFDNELWVSDETLRLGAGDTVDLRIPLRSSAQGAFVLRNGERLPGRAFPETRYHPLDRDGAREKSRRVKIQDGAIHDLKRHVDPTVDPAVELLKGVNRGPLAGAHGAIIRLSDSDPERAARDDDDARRAFIDEFLAVCGPKERRTDGQ